MIIIITIVLVVEMKIKYAIYSACSCIGRKENKEYCIAKYKNELIIMF